MILYCNVKREYYATHQYFLSKRSLYLVVWKITDGEKGINELHQWLITIQVRLFSLCLILIWLCFNYHLGRIEVNNLK